MDGIVVFGAGKRLGVVSGCLMQFVMKVATYVHAYMVAEDNRWQHRWFNPLVMTNVAIKVQLDLARRGEGRRALGGTVSA